MTPSPPTNYDPVTLFHWLWWKVRCLEASPQEFQHLFEKIAQRLRPDFIRVRPYGHLGDRKCDGLYWGDGTVFQVYSPDWLKQRETVTKIREDLAGAIAEWGEELTKWVFVYNTRLGVGPDIPRILQEQQRAYPGITIEPLSSDALWDLLREQRDVQQRAEILGAPAGYEHLFLLPGTVPHEIEARLREGRFVIVHDILSPINIQDVVQALQPEQPFGPPLYVRTPALQESWELAAQYQTMIVEDALRKGQSVLPKFAVFSLAPIPLAIHLGWLFSDRVEVRPFQYDRERNTWSWDASRDAFDVEFQTAGLPPHRRDDAVDVIIRVALSATILPEDATEAAGDCPVQIDLCVQAPDVMWLCHPEQLTALERVFRGVLRDVNRLVPRCRRIHLFYAGPTGGAIVVGKAVNPRMNPEVALYEYDRRKAPRYEHVLTLR